MDFNDMSNCLKLFYVEKLENVLNGIFYCF